MPSNPQKKRRYPFNRNIKRKLRRIIFMLVAAGIATGINYYNNESGSPSDFSFSKITEKEFTAKEQRHAIEKIRAAKNNTSAQFWVGFSGKVMHILKDDLTGSRHQKFLLSPASDLTLLVSHNIDLASRVKLQQGDLISVYGLYEWNNRGGVIHWTHHDPKGKKKGGWIKANGKVYR